ncbi:amino acid ABC transporter permease [Anaerobium acetethylicum]|uniref:L-cystine transport system permease protein n=1 Tax=Anaerobium acetethylicum TaxID=1619234 RepID=A0A1D3TVK9_9FIRM|nr:amino acid ABC transporter permease [Anaerobium acetethylicum]SCP98173.1 L-cystine transport system permease protein [Anaerobium acetethylicum]
MTRPFEPSFIIEVIPQLLPFLGTTLAIVTGTVLFGSMFGFILARAKIRGRKISKLLADLYTAIIRATPSIVLLFVVFYGLPELLLGTIGINSNGYNKVFFVLIAFSLQFAAVMSEVMRSAYGSVDKGQYEAAVSIGLSERQAFIRIVLPQCIVVALPNFANSLIGLLKEGALAYTIGLTDIMGKGILIIGNNYGAYALETYIALTAIYWGITLLIEKSFHLTENHLSRGNKGISAS